MCRYLWQVPQDLQLDGDQEALTVTVIYDTRALYGTVKASREFTVVRD